MAKMPPVQVIVVDEATLRRIIREELAARPASPPPDGGLLPLPVPPGNAVADDAWTPVKSARAKGPTGSRTYEIEVGSDVKVKGLGRGGKIGDHFYVVGLTTRRGEVNVEVRRAGDVRPRTVKLDRIIYKRPKGHY